MEVRPVLEPGEEAADPLDQMAMVQNASGFNPFGASKTVSPPQPESKEEL